MGRLSEKDRDDFREVASTQAGMRLFSRLIDSTGVNASSFTSDSGLTAFNEGRRNVGLSILNEIGSIEGGKEALLSAERYRANLYKEDMEAGKGGNQGAVRKTVQRRA